MIVRKAYGAGLYAMSGPAFEPEATLALPTARIAVMGPEAAVNAVFANKIAAIEDPDERAAFIAEQRRIYEEDVDLLRLASELVVDAVVDFGDLRDRGHPPPRAGPGQGPRTSPTAATASRPSERRTARRHAVVRRLPEVLEPELDARERRVPDLPRVIALPQKAPWHFKLLVVAVALYLGLAPGPGDRLGRTSTPDRYAADPQHGLWRSLVSALVWGTRRSRVQIPAARPNPARDRRDSSEKPSRAGQSSWDSSRFQCRNDRQASTKAVAFARLPRRR